MVSDMIGQRDTSSFGSWKELQRVHEQDTEVDAELRGGIVVPFIVVPALIFIIALLVGLYLWLPLGATLAYAVLIQLTYMAVFIAFAAARIMFLDEIQPRGYTIGVGGANALDAIDHFSSQGFRHFERSSLSDFIAQLDRGKSQKSIVLIDADVEGCNSATIGSLITVRAKCPDTGIILISRGCEDDSIHADFSSVCDITLQKPVSSNQISRAISQLSERKSSKSG